MPVRRHVIVSLKAKRLLTRFVLISSEHLRHLNFS